MKKNIFAGVRINFIAGLAVILPILLTVVIVRFLFGLLNDLAIAPILKVIEFFSQDPIQAEWIARIVIFSIIIFLLVVIGFFARLVFIKRYFGFLERILRQVPMAGKIYGTIKELSNAFLGRGKKLFQKAVLIEYPRKGLYTLGFITTESPEKVASQVNKKLFNVFVPTAPNPTSGIFLLVPEAEIIESGLSVEEALKMVISSGAVAPYDA